MDDATQTAKCPACHTLCAWCGGAPVPLALAVEYRLLGLDRDAALAAAGAYQRWWNAFNELAARHGIVREDSGLAGALMP